MRDVREMVIAPGGGMLIELKESEEGADRGDVENIRADLARIQERLDVLLLGRGPQGLRQLTGDARRGEARSGPPGPDPTDHRLNHPIRAPRSRPAGVSLPPGRAAAEIMGPTSGATGRPPGSVGNRRS